MDVDTRRLRYFVAVAEELHFSRAAARLFLAQQALSRQIKALEDELGTPLFERTTRKVTLTPAGEVFLDSARAALAALDDGVAAARRTGRALAGTLRLGYTPGAALELTPAILGEFQQQNPDVVVEMREFPTGDPSAGLASGVTDIAFIRLPQGTPNIETEAMFTDPVVAMVSTSHPLAERASVTASELVHEPITLANSDDEVYSAFWRLDEARDPGRPPRVVTVTSVTEEANVVAAGAAIGITSAAVMRYTPVPGVRFLPIDDWPGSTLAVGWHVGERSPVIAQFVDVACTVRDRETETVQRIEQWLALRD